MPINPIIYGALNNIALLLAMVLVASLLVQDPHLRNRPLLTKIVLGLGLAAIGLTIMITHVPLAEGMVLDTRSIIISISGLFFGIIPTAILAVAAAAFRIFQGGIGAPVGVMVILSSAAIGCVWNYFRRGELTKVSFRELWLFGLIVHVVMLTLFFIIRFDFVWPIIQSIGLPVLTFFPIGTAVLGMLTRNSLKQRETAQQLVESESRYRNLFQQNHSVMVLLDPSTGDIVSANPAAADFYGWSVDELSRMNISAINQLSREEIVAVMASADAREKHCFHFRHRLKSGEMRDVEVFSGPINLSGRRCLYSIVHDVTERYELQSQMQELNVRLEQKAAEAQAANTAKSQFLANMSHEMRTPLNGIMGMNYLMLESELDEDQREYAETISQCSEVLLQTIDDVLDLAKVEAGKIELESLPLSPADLLESIRTLIEFRAVDKGLKLTFSIDPSVPEKVYGDFGKLRQVLLNLVSNAIKFTEHGGITVKVMTDAQDAAQPSLRFSVCDTGIGIDMQDFNKLFLKFSQLNATNTRRYSGSGLGLAICRSFVEAMDGRISVSSQRGKGTTFSFLIPMRRVAPANLTRMASPINSTSISGIAKIDTGRVLLAEDNPINRRICEDFLRRLGVEYEAVANGQEAVDALAAGDSFDLVLMDIQMPILDGIEATTRIRSGEVDGIDREIPIIALTAHAIKGDAEQFLSHGMNDYISKPMLMGALADKLRKWLACPRSS